VAMRRRVCLALVSGAVIGLAAMVSAGSSRNAVLADSGCTNHSLRGPYGFAVEGQTGATSTGTEPGEIAAAGQIRFDGNGGLTGNEWESFNGLMADEMYANQRSEPTSSGANEIGC